jgi:uncharacterized protein YutE (UPF0331/DUF86 family)
MSEDVPQKLKEAIDIIRKEHDFYESYADFLATLVYDYAVEETDEKTANAVYDICKMYTKEDPELRNKEKWENVAE